MANRVQLDQYDLIATASCVEGAGQIVVFHNNSTHLFVGLRTDPDQPEVMIYDTYAYGSMPAEHDDQFSFVYARALVKMTELALQF